jgi:hypothetical protein
MQKNKKPNLFLSVLINIVIPVLILVKLGKILNLSPLLTLIIALLFPLIYGLYQFFYKKDLNFFSILGFVSVILTGIIGITQLPSNLIILKETSIPLIIGLIILAFEIAGFSLVKRFFNEILHIDKIDQAFKEKNKNFNKTLKISAYLLALVFIISAILNYILAKIIIKSPSGTEAFNQEIGKMLALSFPVIALPAIIMVLAIIVFLMIKIKKTTNQSFDEVFR